MNGELIDQLSKDSGSGCPKCGSNSVRAVGWTWWGGMLGPKTMNHTKCQSCSYTYNSKTRQSNTKGIVLYSVVAGVIGLAVFFLINSRL
jgi:transposase-like protein